MTGTRETVKQPQPELDGELMLALQKGIPICERPFEKMAAELGAEEAVVIEKVRQLFDSGTARRLGAIFDSHSLGYSSSLCAIDVPLEQIEEIAAILTPHPGITHSYQRAGSPNLWFTMTAPSDEMADELKKISDRISPLKLLNLPAIKKFKVQVVFDTSASQKESRCPAEAPVRKKPGTIRPFREMSVMERAVIGELEGSLEVTARPFDSVAEAAGCSLEDLLKLLTEWKSTGIIRRIAVILRHHKIGYTANGMCVWNADPATIEEAGALLASCGEVTHCYERVVLPGFPYNLFAMIHADSEEAAKDILKKISDKAGLSGGRIMFSIREFKKSSMIYAGK